MRKREGAHLIVSMWMRKQWKNLENSMHYPDNQECIKNWCRLEQVWRSPLTRYNNFDQFCQKSIWNFENFSNQFAQIKKKISFRAGEPGGFRFGREDERPTLNRFENYDFHFKCCTFASIKWLEFIFFDQNTSYKQKIFKVFFLISTNFSTFAEIFLFFEVSEARAPSPPPFRRRFWLQSKVSIGAKNEYRKNRKQSSLLTV